MHLSIKIIFIIFLIVSLIAFLETAWTAIRSPENFLSRFENKTGFISPKNTYLIFALFGYIGMTACGFHGLLFWIPESWGTIDEDGQFNSLRSSATILLTMGALPGILIFEKYALAQIKAKEHKETILGVEKIIKNAENLDNFLPGEELKKLSRADIFWLYEIGNELRGKISQIHNLSKADTKNRDKFPFLNEIKTEQTNPVKKENLESKIIEALNSKNYPVISSLNQAKKDEWQKITSQTVEKLWSDLDKNFLALHLKNTNRSSQDKTIEITDAFLKSTGVICPENFKATARYSCDGHYGSTEIFVSTNGTTLSINDSLIFENSIEGICSAFFICHILPTYGRFWHSLYDFDYDIFLENSELIEWLKKSGINDTTVNSFQSINQRPGLYIKLKESEIFISAIGAGLTTSLTDFTVSISEGKLLKQSREIILKSNSTVFY